MRCVKLITRAALLAALTAGLGTQVAAQEYSWIGQPSEVTTSSDWIPASSTDATPTSSASSDVAMASPSAAAAAVVSIPAGTFISATLDKDVALKRDNFGKTFAAHVTRDVMVDGKVVIPAGAPATVRLEQSEEKANQATMRLAEVRVEGNMRDVSTETARPDTQKDKAGVGKKAGIGAAAGAVIGAVTGAGVVKGAVLGAGGGLAWGVLSGRTREVSRGTALNFELRQRVDID
jgi:hypothetical protein